MYIRASEPHHVRRFARSLQTSSLSKRPTTVNWPRTSRSASRSGQQKDLQVASAPNVQPLQKERNQSSMPDKKLALNFDDVFPYIYIYMYSYALRSTRSVLRIRLSPKNSNPGPCRNVNQNLPKNRQPFNLLPNPNLRERLQPWSTNIQPEAQAASEPPPKPCNPKPQKP